MNYVCNLAETVKKPMFMYAKDGNTVVRHYVSLIPLSESLFITKPAKDSYGDLRIDIFIKFPSTPVGLFFQRELLVNENTTDDLVLQYVQNKGCDTPDGFIRYIDRMMDGGAFIKNLEIAFVGQFNPERAKTYKEYHDAYIERLEREQEEKRAKEKAEDEAYCAEQNKLANDAVFAAIAKIKSGGRIKNDTVEFYRSRYDSSVYSIINHLMREYGIKVPLRTQGWINDKLAAVIIENGKCDSVQYFRAKGGKPSEVIYGYIDKLIAAVNAEETEV